MTNSYKRTQRASQSISSDSPAFNNAPDFSVVIPFFNEESNVDPVVRELRDVLENQSHSYEVVLVDDGSVDGTAKLLERQVVNWSDARILQLARNSGQAAALMAGVRSGQRKKNSF